MCILFVGETHWLVTARYWAAKWAHAQVIASVVCHSFCCTEMALSLSTRWFMVWYRAAGSHRGFGTRIGFTSSLSIGATCSWIAAT